MPGCDGYHPQSPGFRELVNAAEKSRSTAVRTSRGKIWIASRKKNARDGRKDFLRRQTSRRSPPPGGRLCCLKQKTDSIGSRDLPDAGADMVPRKDHPCTAKRRMHYRCRNRWSLWQWNLRSVVKIRTAANFTWHTRSHPITTASR